MAMLLNVDSDASHQFHEARELAPEGVLFERRNMPSNDRPSSAVPKDPKSRQFVKGAFRPASASRTGKRLKNPGSSSKDTASFPLRNKAYRIASKMEVESLYENNLAIKTEFNKMKEENMRLKTTIQRLSKELDKKEDVIDEFRYQPTAKRANTTNIKKMHIIGNLKNSIKEQKLEIKRLYDENNAIRQNIRSTKLNEIEIEIQAYVDECTRLRHHLEEIIREKETIPNAYQDYQEPTQPNPELRNLRAENNELHSLLQKQSDEVSNWKERAFAAEKRAKKNSKPNSKQLEQTNKMKTDLQSEKDKAYKLEEEILKQKSLIKQMSDGKASESVKLRNQETEISKLKDQVKELQKKNYEISTTKSREATPMENAQKLQPRQPSPAPERQASSGPPVGQHIRHVLKKIHKHISSKNQQAEVFFTLIDKRNVGMMQPQELHSALADKKIAVKLSYINEIQEYLGNSNIRLNKLSDLYSQFTWADDSASSSSSDDELDKQKEIDAERKRRQQEERAAQEAKEREIEKQQKELKKKREKDEKELQKKRKQEEKELKKQRKQEEKEEEERERQRQLDSDRKEAARIEKEQEEKAAIEREWAEKQRAKEEATQKKRQQEAERLREEEEQRKMEEAKRSLESLDKPAKNERTPESSRVTPDSAQNFSTSSHKRKAPAPIQTDSPRDSSGDENIVKVTKEEVGELLQHISMRMQLHRIPKSKIPATLFGKNYDKERTLTVEELRQIFKKKPFSFSEHDENMSIARYLLEKEDGNMFTTEEDIEALKGKTKDIAGKIFMELGEWEIFTPEVEKDHDNEIAENIGKNKEAFKEACKQYDEDRSGSISLQDFSDVIETMQIEFTDSCLNYMLLLFYSSSFELNSVPYKQFINAYGNFKAGSESGESSPSAPADSDEGSMDSEEEKVRAEYVRECLKIISKALRETKMKPSDVFKPKENKLYINGLVTGLENLGIPTFEKKILIIFMESLQHEEEEEEYCIDYEYLENLLSHYAEEGQSSVSDSQMEGSGLQMSDFESTENRKVQRSVSVLDSPKNELDYSEEETPLRSKKEDPNAVSSAMRISEESPFYSEGKQLQRNLSGTGSNVKLEQVVEDSPIGKMPEPKDLSIADSDSDVEDLISDIRNKSEKLLKKAESSYSSDSVPDMAVESSSDSEIPSPPAVKSKIPSPPVEKPKSIRQPTPPAEPSPNLYPSNPKIPSAESDSDEYSDEEFDEEINSEPENKSSSDDEFLIDNPSPPKVDVKSSGSSSISEVYGEESDQFDISQGEGYDDDDFEVF